MTNCTARQRQQQRQDRAEVAGTARSPSAPGTARPAPSRCRARSSGRPSAPPTAAANSSPNSAMTTQLTAPSRMLSSVFSARYEPMRRLMVSMTSRMRATRLGSSDRLASLVSKARALDQQEGGVQEDDDEGDEDRAQRRQQRAEQPLQVDLRHQLLAQRGPGGLGLEAEEHRDALDRGQQRLLVLRRQRQRPFLVGRDQVGQQEERQSRSTAIENR